MNQIGAMKKTLDMIREDYPIVDNPDCSFEHLQSMYDRAVIGNFSEAKLGRWLGYIQGVCVAYDVLTLEQCKEINKSFAGNKPEGIEDIPLNHLI